MAVLIAGSGGVIALTAGNSDKANKADSSSAVVTEAVEDENEDASYDDSADDAEDYDADESGVAESDLGEESNEGQDATQAQAETTGETSAEAGTVPTSYDGTVTPSVPVTDQIISGSMSVQFVVDHSTGAEASPRVVFGEDYAVCYLVFSEKKTFEMCLDPASGSIRTGTYEIYDDVVSVSFDDGGGSEYDLLFDEDGNITHVIVNYGDYDVYFSMLA